MKLRTEVILNKHTNTLNHKHKFFLIGSCFTENIGNKLNDSGFEVLQNPFGILFNPHSIANCIYRILEKKKYTADDYLYHNQKYINFDLHGKYNDINIQTALQNINDSIQTAHGFFKKADCLIVTFGTAWVYEYDNKIVANCHKVEQTKFTKRLLNLEEIIKQYNDLIAFIKLFNNEIRIIFTLSPVRHLRDGFVENQLSKSLLHLAIHELMKLYKDIEYFPAYEIQMDDLRDYRFCKEDMIHPSDQAIEYVWQKFYDRYFSNETIKLIEEFNVLTRLKNHKMISTDLSAQEKHINKINEIEKSLMNKVKGITT